MINKYLFKALFITAIIVIVYSYLIIPFGIFNKAKFFSMDSISWYIYKLSQKPDKTKDIVVISVDTESLRNLGKKWPWSRDIFANLLLKLKEYHAKAIYLDFAFIGEAPEDEMLSNAIADSKNVIIPFYFNEYGNPLFPVQRFLESADGFGPVNKLRDEDLTIRDALLVYFSPGGKIIDYSIELITACKYFGVTIGEVSIEKDDLVINLKEKGIKIPIKRNGTMSINYLAKLDDIETIPFWKVVKDDLPLDIFKDKIVIVGLTDKSLLETYRTPLGMASGIEIVANTILTIISGDFIRYVSKDINFPIILLLMIIITYTIFRNPPLTAFFISMIEVVGFIGLLFLLSWYGYRFEIFSTLFLGVVIFVVIEIYRFICLLEEQNLQLQEALKDLKESEAELIESERLAAIGKLSAQLSHEIKNPLSAIQNNINTVKYILKQGLKTEKIVGIIEQVGDEIKRLATLSHDILSFSRPAKEISQPININNIIEETINFYSSLLRDRRVNISLQISRDIPAITASPDRLKQVFSNIILNAIDAMPKGGAINITTKITANRYVEVDIADTGCGIPDEIADKIFEPFFTTKKGSKGTGLGLFTVYTIIKGYGGVINVEKNVPNGAIFIIQLPVGGIDYENRKNFSS